MQEQKEKDRTTVYAQLNPEQKKEFDDYQNRSGLDTSSIVRLGLKSIKAIGREPLLDWEIKYLTEAGIEWKTE